MSTTDTRPPTPPSAPDLIADEYAEHNANDLRAVLSAVLHDRTITFVSEPAETELVE